MRYSLRTLLVLLIILPPLGAAVWRETAKLRVTPEEELWIDVPGPGSISVFSTNCTFGPDVEEDTAEKIANPANLDTVDRSDDSQATQVIDDNPFDDE